MMRLMGAQASNGDGDITVFYVKYPSTDHRWSSKKFPTKCVALTLVFSFNFSKVMQFYVFHTDMLKFHHFKAE